MNELVQSSLQFPTVVFTIALGIVLVYWLFVLLGALHINLLGDADFDGDVGGDVGGDAGGDVGHDAGHDGDVDGPSVWTKAGLGAVPLTITISFITLIGWTGSLLAMNYVVGDNGLGKALLLPIVLLAALLLTGQLVRPLRPVFAVKEGKTHESYVGHLCTVTTNTVDDAFGFANIEDGGSIVQISVRCDKPGKLVRGDKALIIEFDPARRTFVVEPNSDLLPGGTQ
ncbi:MAG TPA: hypothetical protein VGM90_18280 [Kofleriaceae bacterium]